MVVWLAAAIMCVPAGQALAQGSTAGDRAALQAFYRATGGPNWNVRTNWMSAAPLSEWYGVATNESGRVTALDLWKNSLRGRLPPAVGRLTQLQTLRLSANQLSGTIPPELGGLTQLRWLALRFNGLRGTIPPELGQLNNLGALELGYNGLSGTIPPELGQLNNLVTLELQSNRLSGPIPTELGQLNNLKLLEMADNRLSGTIPPELGQWTKLTSLQFQYNNLSGPIPPELGQLSNLRWLHLHHNRLSGPIPPELGGLSNLEDLTLRNNPLIGPIPHDLTQLSELAYLDIRNTQVCVPSDAALQAWLETIHSFRSSRLACNRTRWVLFSASSYEVREGQSIWVSVRLIDPTGDPGGSVRIGLTALPGGSATGADYTGVPEHIDIPTAGGEASFAVRAVRDNRVDPGEMLVLGFRQPLPPGVTAGDPDRVTVTIHEPGAEGVTDREVLDVLYHATGGPQWLHQANWLSAAPLSEWHGVTTDGSGRVTELDLWHNQLAGSIPPELGRLSHLQRLDLGRNLLTGVIPADLGGLAQLEDLDLGNNRLSGRIPPELGGLVQLQRLHLGDNRLSGPIPPELGGLSNLQALNLGNNRLSGRIPPESGGLTQLQGLDLGDNRLSGPIPPELGGLAQLEELDLRLNLLSGAIPPELSGLSDLRELDLRHNWLSGPIPPELGRLAQLRVLGLGGNSLTGTIPPELAGLTRLEELNLRFSLVGGPAPTWLPQLPLTTLDLMATPVCVPEDAEYREWLETIEFTSSGLPCGRPADAMSSIDIAVFYTPAARRDAGGTAGIEALIDLMIAETNQAYQESGVNQQVVLVARQEVEYQEVGESGWLALESLVDPSDGDMDEVHAIRDQAGADLVHLIPSVTDVGGLARLTGAFGYTCSECDSRVFAHELGHNMGLHHDRYVRLQSRTFPYSRGYVNQRTFGFRKPRSARWRTIMSYPDQCDDAGFSCDWIMRFSSPNQSYRGDPLGVPGDEPTTWLIGPADAVRTLNTTRHSVASFRPRASGNRLMMPATVSQARSADRTAVPFPGGGLFREVAADARGAASLRGSGALNRATLRQRQVMVDLGRLSRLQDGGSPALRLNLFEDVELLGLIERRTPTYSGGYALSGRLAGVAGGSVTLVVNGNVVAGTVRLSGATFRIRAAGAGRHAILQVDPSRLPQACQPAGRTQGSEH